MIYRSNNNWNRTPPICVTNRDNSADFDDYRLIRLLNWLYTWLGLPTVTAKPCKLGYLLAIMVALAPLLGCHCAHGHQTSSEATAHHHHHHGHDGHGHAHGQGHFHQVQNLDNSELYLEFCDIPLDCFTSVWVVLPWKTIDPPPSAPEASVFYSSTIEYKHPPQQAKYSLVCSWCTTQTDIIKTIILLV